MDANPQPGQVVAARSSTEFVHSFVSTAVVQCSDKLGTFKEEVTFPCRKLSTTAAQHIGSALVANFEYLFGCQLDQAIQKLASSHACVNFIAVGDAATANLKSIMQLFVYLGELGKTHGIVVTGNFSVCLLHQLARILALHIERQALTPALFSISRLHQHSTTRDMTKEAMKLRLQQRFRFHADQFPPASRLNSPENRRLLMCLLAGTWPGESDDGSLDLGKRKAAIQGCLDFFNGDILNQEEWVHYCQGCCSSRAESLQRAPCSNGLAGLKNPASDH
eukprot:Skav211086  [mRNA]  locus=scaffold2002:157101:157934:+ [translate_table: standard]